MTLMSKTKKSSSNLIAELFRGINSVKPYLLSHHSETEVRKYLIICNQRICSRCLGIYLGFLIGFFLFYFNLFQHYYLIYISFFPLPMLLDWLLTNRKIIQASNFIRVITGFAFGIAYIIGLLTVFQNFPDIPILIIGFVYALIVLFILKSSGRLK